MLVDTIKEDRRCFGERVVDTFYVTDQLGQKLTAKARQTRTRRSLLDAIGLKAPGAAAASGSPAPAAPVMAARAMADRVITK